MSSVRRAARAVRRFTEQLELAAAVVAADAPAARRRARVRRPAKASFVERLPSDVRREMLALAQVFAEPVRDLPSTVTEKLEQLRWPARVYPAARTPDGLPPSHERAFEVRRTADGMVLAEGSSVADAADKALFLWRAR